MNFTDDVTYEVYYEHINITILDVNVINMSLIIYKGNYDAIDAYDTHVRVNTLSHFPHLNILLNKNRI